MSLGLGIGDMSRASAVIVTVGRSRGPDVDRRRVMHSVPELLDMWLVVE
jgi:hypothetical protein